MNKKIIIISMIFILTFLMNLGYLNAQIDIGTTKQGDCITLYQSCPTCTYSDIRAIKYPNGTIDNSMDWTMIKNNSDYTYSFCSTNDLGEYKYIVYGDKGGLSYESTEEGVFEVTVNGKTLQISESIIYILLSLFTIGLFSLFLYLGMKTKWEDKTNIAGFIVKINKSKYLKLLYLWFASGFFVWSVQILALIINSYIELDSARNFITDIFIYSGRLSVGITVLFLMLFIIFLWKDIVMSEEIKRYGRSLTKKR